MSEQEIIEKAHKALLNATGAYRALRRIPSIYELAPGIDSCENNCKEAIKTIEEYRKQKETK